MGIRIVFVYIVTLPATGLAWIIQHVTSFLWIRVNEDRFDNIATSTWNFSKMEKERKGSLFNNLQLSSKHTLRFQVLRCSISSKVYIEFYFNYQNFLINDNNNNRINDAEF